MSERASIRGGRGGRGGGARGDGQGGRGGRGGAQGGQGGQQDRDKTLDRMLVIAGTKTFIPVNCSLPQPWDIYDDKGPARAFQPLLGRFDE